MYSTYLLHLLNTAIIVHMNQWVMSEVKLRKSSSGWAIPKACTAGIIEDGRSCGQTHSEWKVSFSSKVEMRLSV